MKRKPEPGAAPQQANPTQAKHWWEAVAKWLAEVERDADFYLPNDAMHEGAVTEILDALTSAKTAADTAFGAYHRVSKAQQEAYQQQALPQPAQQTTARQPTYG